MASPAGTSVTARVVIRHCRTSEKNNSRCSDICTSLIVVFTRRTWQRSSGLRPLVAIPNQHDDIGSSHPRVNIRSRIDPSIIETRVRRLPTRRPRASAETGFQYKGKPFLAPRYRWLGVESALVSISDGCPVQLSPVLARSRR